ncbi:cupin domain-containing protein [Parashewanella curva]|uniref:Cupin domain-containing protein n=1 Tax=Parashewanella curva TaxID=2338552 RepID=A0A3L8PSP6_9GAMM|nr:cupin domain-containing protein [Parashewanella curva]RLV58386.1 cupin domain-containing protein [Parashewanella curva]
MISLNFDIQSFLKQQWQKQPIVIRNAIKDFEDPITADELAGLACEEVISSRVVVTTDDDWQIIQGPFEDYEQFGSEKWQLLVQAVNHWYPEIEPLVDAFRFIPDWRFDDVMVSFATPNGGVGPHIDNYDVFILQGEGQRAWKVGDKGNHQQRNGDKNTPLVEDFDPIIEVTLNKGDILYIPPGFPHCGQTLTNAMSYSLGFRAPSQQELISEVADFLIDNNSGHQRFTSDQETCVAGNVVEAHQKKLMSLLSELCSKPDAYQPILGQLLSRNRFDLDVCPDEHIDTEALKDAIEAGALIQRIGGLKVLRLENDGEKRLFIDGESYALSTLDEAALGYLSENLTYDNEWLRFNIANEDLQSFFVDILKMGYVYLTE